MEYNIRISLYYDEFEEPFKLYLFKIHSVLDAIKITKALKQYHKADYADIEIINLHLTNSSVFYIIKS